MMTAFIAFTSIHVSVELYEGCPKSSELYLMALSRDTFARHAMYQLKELFVCLQMMLISPRCIVSFNSYGIIYIAYSLPLAFFHVI